MASRYHRSPPQDTVGCGKDQQEKGAIEGAMVATSAAFLAVAVGQSEESAARGDGGFHFPGPQIREGDGDAAHGAMCGGGGGGDECDSELQVAVALCGE
jgi:hypothetical protein